jgi:hypothetical protein
MSSKKQKKDEIDDGIDLPGWPGYRTRSNRSGLDPLDTRSEAAHMQGTFLRNIFTLRARTRNPFYLALMFILGVVPFVATVALIIVGMPSFDRDYLAPILYLIVLLLVTGAVTINFVLSVLEIFKVIPSIKHSEGPQSATRKKKFPKRRKDFR